MAGSNESNGTKYPFCLTTDSQHPRKITLIKWINRFAINHLRRNYYHQQSITLRSIHRKMCNSLNTHVQRSPVPSSPISLLARNFLFSHLNFLCGESVVLPSNPNGAVYSKLQIFYFCIPLPLLSALHKLQKCRVLSLSGANS